MSDSLPELNEALNSNLRSGEALTKQLETGGPEASAELNARSKAAREISQGQPGDRLRAKSDIVNEHLKKARENAGGSGDLEAAHAELNGLLELAEHNAH